MFKSLESAAAGTQVSLRDALDAVPFNDQGLVPAIAQDVDTHEVLMLAWMNRTAIEQTLSSGQATYFSRSRNALWRKGETSGHTQALVSMHLDCDGDTVLMQVRQQGSACHTMRRTCFYLELDGEQVTVTATPPERSQNRDGEPA